MFNPLWGLIFEILCSTADHLYGIAYLKVDFIPIQKMYVYPRVSLNYTFATLQFQKIAFKFAKSWFNDSVAYYGCVTF